MMDFVGLDLTASDRCRERMIQGGYREKERPGIVYYTSEWHVDLWPIHMNFPMWLQNKRKVRLGIVLKDRMLFGVEGQSPG
ncbi:hypothetical protein TNCV_4282451 [Trichonephila clavipes]|nr:hypothetical protein TNCV_4282451 [Trichonephila clavipes]